MLQPAFCCPPWPEVSRHGSDQVFNAGIFQDELLAMAAAFFAASPREAWHWCLVSSEFRDIFLRFNIWGRLTAVVSWPPRLKRTSALLALAKHGSECTTLFVDGMLGGTNDIASLAGFCPSVRELEVTSIGSEGLDPVSWNVWGRTLTRLSLSFFYDAIDGPPALREVLHAMVEHCHSLEDLRVAGMDWSNARQVCLAALAKQGAPKLRRLQLLGTAASPTTEEQADLRAIRPDLEVQVAVRPLPNLDW